MVKIVQMICRIFLPEREFILEVERKFGWYRITFFYNGNYLTDERNRELFYYVHNKENIKTECIKFLEKKYKIYPYRNNRFIIYEKDI